MIASYILSLREGLEAALIVGVLLGTLKKLDRTEYQFSIWFGTGLAVFLSVVFGIVLNIVGASFEGRAEEIFEGSAMLLAAAILTWVILWMKNQSQTINLKLKTDVQQAVIKESKTALFFLVFLSVIREGIELAIFLTATSMDAEGVNILLGTALGLASVIILAILLFKSLIRLNVVRFFQVTSIILILFAAGLVAHGVHEFNESGIIPSVVEHLWDINHILDEKSTVGELLKALVGYNGNPSLTEVIAYVLYFVFLWIANRYIPRKGQTLAVNLEKVS